MLLLCTYASRPWFSSVAAAAAGTFVKDQWWVTTDDCLAVMNNRSDGFGAVRVKASVIMTARKQAMYNWESLYSIESDSGWTIVCQIEGVPQA